MEEQAYDIVVVGGGLVGSSLAAALDGSGLRVALVDAQPEPASGGQRDDWDVRVFAISPGSERFLTSIDAWPSTGERIAPVMAMRVYGDGSRGAIGFDAREAGAHDGRHPRPAQGEAGPVASPAPVAAERRPAR